ncbi:MAG TPA: hypothetical protein VII76_08600 [Acidimicrobiales bacterium]
MTSPSATRAVLHRVAAHILARRRFAVSGRFGLRSSPGGIATPTFGDDLETVRTAGGTLVREVGGTTTRLALHGSTLRQLAGFVDVDLDEPFSCGDDTPVLGPVDTPLELVPTAVSEMGDWFALAWRVLDDVLASVPGGSEVATIQLWPEHFDAATTVTLPTAEPVNLGFSPGDGFESEPYVYVGPWGSPRPGDPSFWNAPFGAVRRRSDLLDAPDPSEFCRQFLTRGLRQATSP